MDIEGLAAQLAKHNPTEVAYKTGLSMGTIHNIISGRNTNPTWQTMDAINKFILEKQNEHTAAGKKA